MLKTQDPAQEVVVGTATCNQIHVLSSVAKNTFKEVGSEKDYKPSLQIVFPFPLSEFQFPDV